MTKSSSVGRSTVYDRAPCAAGDDPFAPADQLVVRHEPVVAVELAALDERDEVATLLGVDQQCLLAGLEQRHLRRRATSSTGTRSCAEALSTSRQNAQTSPVVGEPHREHVPTEATVSARTSASSGTIRSTKLR